MSEIGGEDSGVAGAAMSSAAGGAPGVSAERPARQRPSATAVADTSVASGAGLREGLFTAAVLRYAMARPGRSIALLQAGCTTAGGDLNVGRLRAAGYDVTVSLIDDDTAAARAAVAADPGLARCTLDDLRVVPLTPRSVDIVHCTALERIANAELVLDRLVETLRPGGLLLLRIRDRDCAAGFLDRVLPRPLRLLVFGHPAGAAHLYPAVYEPIVSDRGIQSYAQRRGLVVGQRQAQAGPADGQGGPAGPRLAFRLTAQLSLGRRSSAHDEVCYVIRKPEPTFARVL